MLVLLALACTGSGDIVVPGDSDAVPAAVHISATPAFDPILGGPASVDVTASSTGASTLSVQIVDADGLMVWSSEQPFEDETTMSFDWDGTREGEGPAQAGAYTISAVVSADEEAAAEATRPLSLVRAGFVQAFAEGDGIIADRVPLYFHQSGSLQSDSEPFTSMASIDTEQGTAANFPAVSADLNHRSTVEPIAFSHDSRPILTLIPGESTLLGGNGLLDARVSVEIDGWTAISGVPLRVGTPVVLMKDEALSAGTVGVIEQTLGIEFHAEDDDGGDWVLGVQQMPVRFYALMGQSGFGLSGAKYEPWAAVVDPSLRGIDGTVAEHNAVINALVQWIYWENGLRYDTQYGASAYVEYAGDWDDANFYLADFLTRRFGTVINCTDCAAILGAYANMLGAKLGYTIILSNFDLNYIQAIGGDEFDRCPFGDTGCGFSYHAVTTSDGGDTIWDATLALDGDADPSQLPSTFLQVEAIDGDEYLMRLSPGSPRYQYESQGTLQ